MSGQEEVLVASKINMKWNIKQAASIFLNNLPDIDNRRALKQATKFKDYLTTEEYNAELVAEDLNEGCNGSCLVDVVAEDLGQSDVQQLQEILRVLKIIFLAKAPKLKHLAMLDWTVHKSEEKRMRKYMTVQCPKMIKEDEDGALLQIMAIGEMNGIPNLLCLIYDAFTRFRMHHRLIDNQNTNNNTNNYGQKSQLKRSKDFCVSSEPLFRGLSKTYLKSVEAAINSYEKRFITAYKFDSPTVMYDDKCEVFIEYSILVAKALKNFIVSMNERKLSLTPIQVDLLIIPQKIVPVQTKMITLDSFDSDDDDDDDDEDSKTYDNYTADVTLATPEELARTFEEVMIGKFKQKYSKQFVVYNDPQFWRIKIASLFEQYVGGKNYQRISIVIDRRTTPDTIYFFTLPGEKSVIPDNYCATTLVYLSAQFVIPILDESYDRSNKFPFVGGSYASGQYFMVSYQMMDEEHTRLQWNFAGNGMRLTPEVMVKVWPDVFVNSKLREEYTEDYVRTKMDMCDPSFDEWIQVRAVPC